MCELPVTRAPVAGVITNPGWESRHIETTCNALLVMDWRMAPVPGPLQAVMNWGHAAVGGEVKCTLP